MTKIKGKISEKNTKLLFEFLKNIIENDIKQGFRCTTKKYGFKVSLRQIEEKEVKK
jgi:hypothetical protein